MNMISLPKSVGRVALIMALVTFLCGTRVRAEKEHERKILGHLRGESSTEAGNGASFGTSGPARMMNIGPAMAKDSPSSSVSNIASLFRSSVDSVQRMLWYRLPDEHYQKRTKDTSTPAPKKPEPVPEDPKPEPHEEQPMGRGGNVPEPEPEYPTNTEESNPQVVMKPMQTSNTPPQAVTTSSTYFYDGSSSSCKMVQRIDSDKCKTGSMASPIEVLEARGTSVKIRLSQPWTDRDVCDNPLFNHIDFVVTKYNTPTGEKCDVHRKLGCDDAYELDVPCTDGMALVDMFPNDWAWMGNDDTTEMDPNCGDTEIPLCSKYKYCHMQYVVSCGTCLSSR